MTEVNLTGLGSSFLVPGLDYVEVNYGVGDASGANKVHRVIFLACKSGSGSASVETLYGPDTIVPMSSEADAMALFGAGSPAHIAVRRFMQINQTTPCYVMCPSSTGSAATGTPAVSGTASAPGYLRFWKDANEFVDVSFATGDGYAAIATNLASAINGRDYWPFTASAAASGTVTLTAKVTGANGNQHRYMCKVFGSSTGITVTPSTSTALSSGSGSVDYTNVLAAIAEEEFYYIVPENSDQTTLALIKTQIATQALPINGRRQRLMAASVDSLANTITIANALNHARCEMLHLYQSDWTPIEMLGHWAANVTLQEEKLGSAGIAVNMSLYGQTPQSEGLFFIPAPLSKAVPTVTNQNSAITAGISPVVPKRGGRTIVADRVTTRSLNGSNPDRRIAETGKVLICDRFTDDLMAKFVAQFSHGIISADLDEDAQVPPGIVQPRQIKAAISQLVVRYKDLGLLKEVSRIISGMVVSPSIANPTRMGVIVPLFCADSLKQMTTMVNQVF